MLTASLRTRTKGTYWRVVGSLLTILLASGSIPVQTQQPTSREIIAEDFIKNRPKTQTNNPQRNKRVYRPAGSAPGSYDSAIASSSRPAATSTLVEQLGVTIWRLRPARAVDTGARMLMQDGSRLSEWVAERIEADTPINIGDLVRITIESPRTGYLYVVDRELYADGTKGEGFMIFPTLTTRGGDNRVQAGKLVDIPGQEDQPFRAARNKDDQIGELLTIIVTSTPLDLPISKRPLPISGAEIAKWESAWTIPIERFEMVGGAGQTWTDKERQAAADRGSRQLTQDDPTPQTIYHLVKRTSNPILINLKLMYGK